MIETVLLALLGILGIGLCVVVVGLCILGMGMSRG